MDVNDTQSVVAQVIQSLVDAWNQRDAAWFGNLFSEDADYIDGNGRWFKGRREIAGLCVGAGETVSVIEAPSIRVYGDVAIASFRWTSVEDESTRGIITCVVSKDGSSWTIVVLQNTDFT
jgi:uncharacterized protein (TIGR02246 family)